jgi:two-component system chemotaxis response regulator CheB
VNELDPTASVARAVVAVGASAGGVAALGLLASCLPADLPAGVLVVLHLGAQSASHLPHILSRQGPLPASPAVDGGCIEPGHIYVAAPGRHLVVEPGRTRLWDGPPEHSSRPAIDVTFRTLAAAYGTQAAAMVLSGTLNDGSMGLAEVKHRSGLTLVQDPDEASRPEMPMHAIAFAAPDHVAPIAELARITVEWARALNRLRG